MQSRIDTVVPAHNVNPIRVAILASTPAPLSPHKSKATHAGQELCPNILALALEMDDNEAEELYFGYVILQLGSLRFHLYGHLHQL
jgi:hypothetical protein